MCNLIFHSKIWLTPLTSSHFTSSSKNIIDVYWNICALHTKIIHPIFIWLPKFHNSGIKFLFSGLLQKISDCLICPNQGRIQEFWLGGGVKVAGATDQQNLFFKFIYFIHLITFRYTKPGYLNCLYSSVTKKWSAIFVRCIVPEIYSCFWRSPEPYLISVLF